MNEIKNHIFNRRNPKSLTTSLFPKTRYQSRFMYFTLLTVTKPILFDNENTNQIIVF